MKKAIIYVLLSVFIVLGIVFAIFNVMLFMTHQKHAGYLVIGIIGALETIMSTISLFLYFKAKKGRWVNAIYIFSLVLCGPILFLFVIWIALLLLSVCRDLII